MIPPYEAFLNPALRAVDAGQAQLEAIAESAAQELALDRQARTEVVDYDSEPVFWARTRLALKDLRIAGLVVEQEGFRLTGEGKEALKRPLDRAALEGYPAYAAYRQTYLARRGA